MNSEKTIPEFIYHYTSYESFYNILRTRQLHLSSPWNANDPLEGEYHHRGLNKGKKQRYFISFSTKFDSRLMWDAYGDQGKGIAIGFKAAKLREIVDKEWLKWENFLKEKYLLEDSNSEPKENSIIIPPIHRMSDFYNLHFMNYDADSEDWNKMPFYVEEDEIRLSISNYWLYFEYLKETQVVPKLETKFVNGWIRDYIPLQIFELTKGSFLEIIPEIIIGPNFDNKNKISLEVFIQSHFDNCSYKVEHLDCTDLKPEKKVCRKDNNLNIFISRGNPKSIEEYKKQSIQ